MATNKRLNGNCIFDNVDYSYPTCGGIMVFKGRKNYRFEVFSNYQGQKEYTFIIPFCEIDLKRWKGRMEYGWGQGVSDLLELSYEGIGKRIYRGTIY